MTFKHKIVIGFGAGAILLIFVAVLSLKRVLESDKDRERITHTHVVKEKIDSLMIDLLEAETNERGYIVTGDTTYLQPYQAAQYTARQDFLDLREFSADNPTQIRTLNELDPLFTNMLSGFGDQIELRQQNVPATTAEGVRLGLFNSDLDQIKDLIGQLGREENRLLKLRLAKADTPSRMTKLIILAAGGLGFVILILAGITANEIVQHRRANEEILNLNSDLEKRVWERTAELETAHQEMEAFSSSVSHDLRGPLHIIDGFSMMLEENCGRALGSDGQKYLTGIHNSVRHMANIIEDLLKLSRLGRQELKLEATHLGELLEPILNDIKADIRQRQIEWKVGELPLAECDRGLTKHVFINLVANSVKYTHQRGAAIIEIGKATINGETAIFVRDNGTGFDAISAGKLFSAFQRFHRQEEFEGTGVGLATVRRIIHRHGGRIWAEAEPDKGATFYFTLGSRQG